MIAAAFGCDHSIQPSARRRHRTLTQALRSERQKRLRLPVVEVGIISFVVVVLVLVFGVHGGVCCSERTGGRVAHAGHRGQGGVGNIHLALGLGISH